MLSSRREFITRALYSILTLLGLAFLVPSVDLFAPAGVRNKELVFFPLLNEEDIPRLGVKKMELAYTVSASERKARVFLVASADTMTVFSAICSHLGCLVNYHKEKREFICPCHGGRYDLNGQNIAGPPPAPLTRFPTKIQNGKLYVGIKV